mmetsp:Transcript_5227/g.9010  ORF Transcript_5227/g.9010 Transcript_5227/m.9010 type:complete len:258 (-) Transcript_5227:402-1175(-)
MAGSGRPLWRRRSHPRRPASISRRSVVEVPTAIAAALKEVTGRQTENIYDLPQLVGRIFSFEQGPTSVEFHEDTSKAPNVHRSGISKAEQDLGRAVVTTLDVRTRIVPNATGATKVCHFDNTVLQIADEEVLWLQIAVNYVILMKKDQGLQDLISEATDHVKRKTAKATVDQKMIQIPELHHLEDKANVLARILRLVNQMIFQPDNVIASSGVKTIQSLQKLKLVLCIPRTPNLILDDLQSYITTSTAIIGFVNLSE